MSITKNVTDQLPESRCMMILQAMKSYRNQVLTLILVALIAQPLHAGVIPGHWETVSNLDMGTPITVELKNGDQVIGDFEGLSESGVDVETRSARAVIPKSDIQTIATQEQGGVGTSAVMGATIGAAVGAGLPLVALAQDGSGDMGSGGAALAVLLVAGVGAAIGSVVGAAAGIGTKTEAIVVYKDSDIP